MIIKPLYYPLLLLPLFFNPTSQQEKEEEISMLGDEVDYNILGYSTNIDRETFLKEWDLPYSEFPFINKCKEFFNGRQKIGKGQYIELLVYFLDGRHDGADEDDPKVVEYANKILRPLVHNYLIHSGRHERQYEYGKEDVLSDLVEGRMSDEIGNDVVNEVFNQAEEDYKIDL